MKKRNSSKLNQDTISKEQNDQDKSKENAFKSSTLDSKGNPIEEAKNIGLVDSEEDSSDYDGGESDEEEKEDEDKQKGDQIDEKDKDLDDQEKAKLDKKNGSEKKLENSDDESRQNSMNSFRKNSKNELNTSREGKEDVGQYNTTDNFKSDKSIKAEKELSEDNEAIELQQVKKKGTEIVEEEKESYFKNLKDENIPEEKIIQDDVGSLDDGKKEEVTVASKDGEVEEEQPVNYLIEEIKEEITLESRFEKLTDEEKQRVVDMTFDSALPNIEKDFKYNYHNLAEKLKPEGYSIPNNEKLGTENVSYVDADSFSWFPKKSYKGIEYRPPIIREKYQLSLWKVDRYGVVKVKDRYFTPKTER